MKTFEITTSVKNHVMNDGNGIGVYVGTYRKYNNGSLYGEWLDLSTFEDADEFLAVCAELHKDEHDPEYMFQDYQGFPYEMYSESMNKEEIEKVIEFAKLDDDDREMLADYVECFSEFDVENAEDRSMGKWESMEAYAWDYLDNCMNVPDNLYCYIDIEKLARDLSLDLYMGKNGFIFSAA